MWNSCLSCWWQLKQMWPREEPPSRKKRKAKIHNAWFSSSSLFLQSAVILREGKGWETWVSVTWKSYHLKHPLKSEVYLKKRKVTTRSQQWRVCEGEEGFASEWESRWVRLKNTFLRVRERGKGVRVGEGEGVDVTPRLSCCFPESKPWRPDQAGPVPLGGPASPSQSPCNGTSWWWTLVEQTRAFSGSTSKTWTTHQSGVQVCSVISG